MNKTIINVKTDQKVKEEAQRVAAELGLSLSSVVNAYLRQMIRNKEVHVSIVPQMTRELTDELRHVEYDLARGRNISKAITSGKELDRYLDSL